MRRRLSIALAAALAGLAPRAALASGVVEEVSAGAAPGSGSRWLGDKLAGIWDLDPRWQLRLDLAATRASSGAADLATGAVYLGALSAVYSVDDHWGLRLSGAWSPESITRAIRSLPMSDAPTSGDAPTEVTAELRAAASSFAFGAGIDYDSASDGMHSPSASLSINATYFDARQDLVGLRDTGGAVLDAAGLEQRCRSEMCSQQVLDAAGSQWVGLGQFTLGASVADTIDGDTDLAFDAAYYLYDQDPLQSGLLLALTTVDRSTLGSATSAPLLRESFTPSVAHRWGALSATASLSYAGYADGQQADLGASLRVQYKLALDGSQRLKLYVKLGATTHVDQSYDHANSGSAGLGGQYTW
jgi:hypothetical protein